VTGPALKVYGERNTGTRYLAQLVAANLEVRLLRGSAPRMVGWLGPDSEAMRDWYFRLTVRSNLGWKHRLPPSADDPVLLGDRVRQVGFITVVKNPYSWLLSLMRRQYSSGRTYASIEELVTSPWTAVGRECSPPQFANAVEMWNLKYAACLALPGARTVNLRYEDLLEDPATQVERIASRFSLPRRHATFTNVESSTKRSSQSFDDYRRYYLEERWRAKLTEREFALIGERLDPAVMSAYGYDIV
jgi:hypothetical protein